MFLILGPALNLVAGFFWEDDRQGLVSGTLLALSIGAWLVGLAGIYERLRPAAPRYVAVALPLTVFACVGGLAFAIQSVQEVVFDVSHAVAVERLQEHPFAAYPLYWILGPAFPIALFLLGLAVWRLRAAPAWVGLLIALGALAFPLSRITRDANIAHVADVLLLVPFVYLGLRSLRRSRPPSGASSGPSSGAESRPAPIPAA
ncbi:hypothetical protein AB0J86_17580 [Micromonospora sp. NPDC049559]|uniref:hypothetical protein n=1 Tax=Micromonospora sp. NPDC049559 TaxID=3155923 RepID=UPI0034166395